MGPIPLNWESSALTSSTGNPRRYSRQSWPPLLSLTALRILLILEAFVAARPPHLIAFSRLLGSASRTLDVVVVVVV